MSEEKHIALYYKSGSSDKEYHIHLVPKGTGFIVSIEYGRRGSSLTSANKTPAPVDLDTALGIFNKLRHEKVLKGYTEGEGQTPYVGSDKENKITGVLPQLLNNIDEEDLDDYLIVQTIASKRRRMVNEYYFVSQDPKTRVKWKVSTGKVYLLGYLGISLRKFKRWSLTSFLMEN